MNYIEDTVLSNNIPINSIPVLNRLIELLKKNKTNSLKTFRNKKDLRIEKCFCLLLIQYYGEVSKIDIQEFWEYLYTTDKNKNTALPVSNKEV